MLVLSRVAVSLALVQTLPLAGEAGEQQCGHSCGVPKRRCLENEGALTAEILNLAPTVGARLASSRPVRSVAALAPSLSRAPLVSGGLWHRASLPPRYVHPLMHELILGSYARSTRSKTHLRFVLR